MMKESDSSVSRLREVKKRKVRKPSKIREE